MTFHGFDGIRSTQPTVLLTQQAPVRRGPRASATSLFMVLMASVLPNLRYYEAVFSKIDTYGDRSYRTVAMRRSILQKNAIILTIALFRTVLWHAGGWFCECLAARSCFPSPAIPFHDFSINLCLALCFGSLNPLFSSVEIPV